MLQTKTFKITSNHQKNAAESFQEAASLLVQSCIEKFTSARQRAFRSLLVQVETGQMSVVETGQMSAAETGQMSAVETRQISSVTRPDICVVSTHNVEVSEVSTVPMLKSQKSQLWQCHNVQVADRRSGPKSTKIA